MKRKHTDGSGAPPAKKQKLEDSSEDNPVVTFQKQHMLLRIKELNRELDEARSSQSKYEEEVNAFHDTISVVNRHWSQLDSALSQLLQRVNWDTTDDSDEMSDGDPDQFKQKLADSLKGNAPSILEICIKTKSSRLTKLTQEESAKLEERGNFTRSVVEKLVTALKDNHENTLKLQESLRESVGNENTLAEENKKLVEKLMKMEKDYSNLQVAYSESQRDIKDHKNFSTSMKEKLAVAIVERDQLETKLTLAERKLDKLSSTESTPAASATPAIPTVKMPIASPNTPSASPKVRFKKAAQQTNAGHAQAEINTLKEKLRKAQTLADSRLNEINEYGEQRKVLLQELTNLRNEKDAFTEENILNSIHYLTLKDNLQALQTEFKVMQDSLSNKLKIANEYRNNLQKELQIMKQSDVDMKKSMSQELVQYQMKLEDLSKRNTALLREIELLKKPNSGNGVDIPLLLSQQKQLEKLREDCANLRKTKLEGSELSGKIQELTSQIQEKENQYNELSKKYQTLSENLKNADIAEKVSLHEQIGLLQRKYEELKLNDISNGDALINQIKSIGDLEQSIQKLNEQLNSRQNELEEAKSAIDTQKQESEAYLIEIDEISKELDEAQEQNVRLLEQVSDKDNTSQRLMKECIDLKSAKDLLHQQITILNEELVLAKQKSLKQDELYQVELNVVTNMKDQIAKLQEELQTSAIQLDVQQRKLHETLEKNNELQTQLTTTKSTLNDLKLSDESIISYNQEALNNKRLMEKNTVLKKKLDRLRSSSVLEEELRACKAMITCAICNERQKNAVIAKCYHVFCRECIQRRVSARSRKCPGCSKPFSENDVHDIYLNFQQ